MSSYIPYKTIPKFAEESGYTEHAIRTKFRDGVWRESEVWVKAPDGRILIIVEGYKSWVETALVSDAQAQTASKSPLPIAASDVVRGSGLSPPPLISSRRRGTGRRYKTLPQKGLSSPLIKCEPENNCLQGPRSLPAVPAALSQPCALAAFSRLYRRYSLP